MTRWSLVLSLILVSLLALDRGQALSAEKVKFALVFPTVPVQLPAWAAEEKGFWTQNGLDVQLVPFRGGGPTFRAASAGAIDLGIADLSSTIMSIARQVPVTMVAKLGAPQDYGIWVWVDSPIKQVKNLKGKVGISRVGGTSHAYGTAMIKSLGLTEKVKFVGVLGTTARVAALKSKAIDAMVSSLVSTASLKATGKVRQLVSSVDVLPRELSEEYMIFGGNEFIRKHGDAVKRAVKGIIQGGAYVENNPRWALAKMTSQGRQTAQSAKIIYPTLLYSKNGRIDARKLKTVLNFLIEFGLVSRQKAPPLDRIFSEGFGLSQ